MPIKTYRPTTPSRRFQSVVSREEITKQKPEKSLTAGKLRTGGRSSVGRISSRFRGGGHKKSYRIIDFKRNKIGIPAKVAAIEYDPNRTANIALIGYPDGEKRYILAPQELKTGHAITAGAHADVLPGNALPLNRIPIGTPIHNLELTPGKGGQLVRGAGGAAVAPPADFRMAIGERDAPRAIVV